MRHSDIVFHRRVLPVAFGASGSSESFCRGLRPRLPVNFLDPFILRQRPSFAKRIQPITPETVRTSNLHWSMMSPLTICTTIIPNGLPQ